VPALTPLPVPPAPGKLWYAVVFPASSLQSVTLEQLGRHAQDFTPCVSLEPPDALLLEVRGSVQLFGSLPALCSAIDAKWQKLQLAARSATLPSTFAALWSARAGRNVHSARSAELPAQLAPLPLSCTAWDAEVLQILRGMGVRNLGELLRLPRAGLARRLGVGVPRDLDIALGRRSAPRRMYVARERFRAQRDFEVEIAQVAYLQKAVEPLIEQCASFLRSRQAGVQRLTLSLKQRHGPPIRLSFGLASITSESRRLRDVVGQKLERLSLPAPVRGMELRSGSLRALSAVSLDVFAGLTGMSGRDTAPQLVERLRARLGDTAVYGLRLVPEHRPEAAWGRVQELTLTGLPVPTSPALQAAVVDHLPRPLWLLSEPVPLDPPQLLAGPERIESGWWDGRGVARDYYVARRLRGERLWVFQERLSKRWYLHGLFA
jgi:protein ImuB